MAGGLNGAQPAQRPPRFRPSALRRLRDLATNLGWGGAFVPFFGYYASVEAAHMLAERVRHTRGELASPKPAFKRSGWMPSDRSERSVADVVAVLETFPFPQTLTDRLSFYREFSADGVAMLAGAKRGTMNILHHYPLTFEPRLFTGHEGIQLAGLQAVHSHPAPALIVCHGLMTSKNFNYVRRMAMRAHAKWGFHVIVVDMRSFGESAWTTDAPGTAGYMEGRDVLEIARELRRNPLVTSVGALGYSLGGSTVLNAAHHASLANDEETLSGGVFAVSSPTDIERATRHISMRPSLRHPFFPFWAIWQTGLRAAHRQRGLHGTVRTFHDMLRHVVLPYYGWDEQQFYEMAGAKHWAHEIRVPALALHARDDFVVGVQHAEELRDSSAGNPDVHVWITGIGSHCAFGSVDPAWYYSVVRRWFEYWAEEPSSAAGYGGDASRRVSGRA